MSPPPQSQVIEHAGLVTFRQFLPVLSGFAQFAEYTDFANSTCLLAAPMGLLQLDVARGLESEGFEMLKAMMWSMLGLLITASAAQADHFFYSPADYYVAPVAVRPVYSAPIPVGISYAVAPVVVARPVVVSRPVYVSPVVHTVYSEPVYAAPISTVSYTTTTYAAPVVAAPVYVRPVTVAPVVVPSYGIARESLVVRPHSATYRYNGYGWGNRTVIRARSW